MSNSSEAVVSVRKLIERATPKNSRLTAAAIGRYLDDLVPEAQSHEQVEAAVESLRDASLALLVTLHRSRDVYHARVAAIRAADFVEAMCLLTSSTSRCNEAWAAAA